MMTEILIKRIEKFFFRNSIAFFVRK